MKKLCVSAILLDMDDKKSKYRYIDDPSVAIHEASDELVSNIEANDMSEALGDDLSLDELVARLQPPPKTYATTRRSSDASAVRHSSATPTVRHSSAVPTVRKSSQRHKNPGNE